MMKGGMAGLMKQAQQMQENMKKMQDQLASVEVEGQSGAGMVKVQMTCKYDVRRVSIDESVMDDKEMLEDLVAAALNDAVRKVEAATQEKMASVTAGLNLPPMEGGNELANPFTTSGGGNTAPAPGQKRVVRSSRARGGVAAPCVASASAPAPGVLAPRAVALMPSCSCGASGAH